MQPQPVGCVARDTFARPDSTGVSPLSWRPPGGSQGHRHTARPGWPAGPPQVPPEFEKLMLANYAQIVRRSVLTTAAIGAVMIVISLAVGGTKGLLGAVLGAALVAIFFAISVFAVGRAAKRSPQAMMITALTTYIVKILLLLFFVVRFSDTTVFSSR